MICVSGVKENERQCLKDFVSRYVCQNMLGNEISIHKLCHNQFKTFSGSFSRCRNEILKGLFFKIVLSKTHQDMV